MAAAPQINADLVRETAAFAAVREPQRLRIKSAANFGPEVRIEAIRGTEEISAPYRYEATLVSSSALRASGIVGKEATFSIAAGEHEFAVHGIILEFTALDPTVAGDFVYKLVLVPRLKLLDFTMQNQIYGTEEPLTLPTLIKDALTGGLVRQSSHSNGHEMAVDYDLRLNGNYPGRSQIAQYDESDLAFLSRSCEHAGVFYFFEHDGSREKAIFGDSNVAFAVANLPSGELPYWRGNVSSAQTIAVTSLQREEKVLPRRIYLSEHNDMMPGMELLSQAEISQDGVGFIVQYGQNFATPDEGNGLAIVRAQEIACQGSILRGVSTAPQLRPGYIFTISQHLDSSLNGRYLVTAVTHSAAAPFALGQDSGVEHSAYGNQFTAIPASAAFRPRRVTPKPIAAGLYGAKVDGEGSGDRAELDQYGRYKLRLFYDDGNSPDGTATQYVTKAQPYAGKNDSGMHFPLLKGTEVVLAYINGDPDRPLIVGAVPNPLTPNVVTSTNSTRNRMATTSGAMFEIEDGAIGGAAAAGFPGSPQAPGVPFGRAAKPGLAATVGVSLFASPHVPPSRHTPAHSSLPHSFSRISVSGSYPSYFRLGANVDTDSPADSTTWSTGLSAYKSTASASGAAVTSSSSADDLYTETLSTSTLTADSYTNGIVLGTNGDLIINAGATVGAAANTTSTIGSVLMKANAGITTEVVHNDHATTVKDGAYTVAASEGIYMNAGPNAAGAETNISLTASGYVKTKSKGDSYVFSESNSYTYIDADKIQVVKGNNKSTTYGQNFSHVEGADYTFKVGERLVLYVGQGLQLNLSNEIKVTMAADIQLVAPIGIKIVTGTDLKLVWGNDAKIVVNDMKIVTGGKYELVVNGTNLITAKTVSGAIKQVAVGIKNETLVVKAANSVMNSISNEIASTLTGLWSIG
jgi:type VI secretion system secreted protein VgrG